MRPFPETKMAQAQVDSPEAQALQKELAAIKGPWHSPIDLGHGVITGDSLAQRRFQRRIKLMGNPNDLTGKRVLDIGAYDGFFSFEFERRGADVLSVDIWNDVQWEKFQFAIEKKQSKIKHQRIDVHDLSPDAVGGTFDLVFCAGVLYHLRYPLKALESIRSVTGHQLILETVTMIPFVHESFPMVAFFPGDEEAIGSGIEYGISGAATPSWIQAGLRTAGFSRVECKYLPSMRLWKKLVALATNKPQGGRSIHHAFV